MTRLISESRTGVAGELAALAAPLFGAGIPVRLRAWDGSEASNGLPEGAPTLVLNSPDALRRLLWHPGELGLAQAYVTGEVDVEGGATGLADGFRRIWASARSVPSSPSLRTVAGLVPRALGIARSSGALGAPLPAPDTQARLRGRLHTGRRDRAAIAHHYDLSNEFYALILDPNMAYSCGYWTSEAPGYTLTDAQNDKLDLICRKLDLRPGQRLLDVGCGWGSLSLYAAQHYGVKVTGVTLSAQQAAFVRARIAELGLDGDVEVRLQDYRELAGEPYDAVASVEMGEHVGQANYPVYAATLHRMVKPGGRVLVQQMSRTGKHPGGGAFIEAYIAPDMHMRPVGETVAFFERAGLEVRDVHALREHYVRTVAAWTDTFEAHWAEVVAMVGEETARVWRLYLVGGGLAFEEARMGVDQILAVRAAPGGSSGMPPVRGF